MCVEICDDGLVVGHEVCDDNITNWGCQSDCRSIVGEIPGNKTAGGWNCFNSSNPDEPSLNITICEEICGDGLRVGNETCDDGIVDNWGCCDSMSYCSQKC